MIIKAKTNFIVRNFVLNDKIRYERAIKYKSRIF